MMIKMKKKQQKKPDANVSMRVRTGCVASFVWFTVVKDGPKERTKKLDSSCLGGKMRRGENSVWMMKINQNTIKVIVSRKVKLI